MFRIPGFGTFLAFLAFGVLILRKFDLLNGAVNNDVMINLGLNVAELHQDFLAQLCRGVLLFYPVFVIFTFVFSLLLNAVWTGVKICQICMYLSFLSILFIGVAAYLWTTYDSSSIAALAGDGSSGLNITAIDSFRHSVGSYSQQAFKSVDEWLRSDDGSGKARAVVSRVANATGFGSFTASMEQLQSEPMVFAVSGLTNLKDVVTNGIRLFDDFFNTTGERRTEL